MLCRLSAVRTRSGIALFAEPGPSLAGPRFPAVNGWEMYHAVCGTLGSALHRRVRSGHPLAGRLNETFAVGGALSAWHPVEAPARFLSLEPLPYRLSAAVDCDEVEHVLVEVQYAADHRTVEEDLRRDFAMLQRHYAAERKWHALRLFSSLLLIPVLSGNELLYAGVYFPVGAWICWHHVRCAAAHLVVQAAANFETWCSSGRVRFVASPGLAALEAHLMAAKGLLPEAWVGELQRWEELPRPWAAAGKPPPS